MCPSSVTARVLSNTVFHFKYGKKTFIRAAPCPIFPFPEASRSTAEENRAPRLGKYTGLLFLRAAERASVSSRNVCDMVPEER